jgi:hypothetical protein
VTWDQVSLANASQLGDYTMVVPKVNDRIFQFTNKYSGGNIIIIALVYLYEFVYSFSLQGFVRDVLRYYNLSLA